MRSARCRLDAKPGRTFAEAVAHASVETAIDLSATAIVAPSMSGHTARTISKFRPPCPIVAVTPSPFVQRELCIFWGVYPLLSQRAATTDAVINDAVEKAQQAGFVGEGDVVVVTGGSVEGAGGTTNLMKVHLIERVLAHGLGLGDRKVIGRARRLEAPVPADVRVEPDEIIVTSHTDRSFLPALRRCAGLVTSDARPDAHARLAALELGLPAIVGIHERHRWLPRRPAHRHGLQARRGVRAPARPMGGAAGLSSAQRNPETYALNVSPTGETFRVSGSNRFDVG